MATPTIASPVMVRIPPTDSQKEVREKLEKNYSNQNKNKQSLLFPVVLIADIIFVAEEDGEGGHCDGHDDGDDDISNVEAAPGRRPRAAVDLLVVVASSRLLLLSTRPEQGNRQEVDHLPEPGVVLQGDQWVGGSSSRHILHKDRESHRFQLGIVLDHQEGG